MGNDHNGITPRHIITGVGFSSDAARAAIRRFFAGFLRCDSRTIMKSFYSKKLLANSQEIYIKISPFFLRIWERFFLRNDFILVRLLHLRDPAKNLRLAELRLMRNPPLVCNTEAR